jgi:hypothetical protein
VLCRAKLLLIGLSSLGFAAGAQRRS